MGLLVLFALIWLNWQHPVLRFTFQSLNHAIGFIGLLSPFCAGVMAYSLRRWWVPLLITAPLLYFAILCLFAVPYTLLGVFEVKDDSFECFRELPWQHTRVRAYRLNGGATTDYGVAIRQERPILPGVLLVRELDLIYPCYSADLQIIAPHQLQVHVPCHRSQFEETRIFPLKGCI